MSIFDDISKAVFSTVETIFGDTVIWLPSDGSAQQSAQVLYKCPENKSQLGDTERYDYNPYDHSFEYYIDQLPGLKQFSDTGVFQSVTINGHNLLVKEVKATVDGRNYIAYCVPNE